MCRNNAGSGVKIEDALIAANVAKPSGNLYSQAVLNSLTATYKTSWKLVTVSSQLSCSTQTRRRLGRSCRQQHMLTIDVSTISDHQHGLLNKFFSCLQVFPWCHQSIVAKVQVTRAESFTRHGSAWALSANVNNKLQPSLSRPTRELQGWKGWPGKCLNSSRKMTSSIRQDSLGTNVPAGGKGLPLLTDAPRGPTEQRSLTWRPCDASGRWSATVCFREQLEGMRFATFDGKFPRACAWL